MDTPYFLSLNLLPFLLAMGGSYWLSCSGQPILINDKIRPLDSSGKRNVGLSALTPTALTAVIESNCLPPSCCALQENREKARVMGGRDFNADELSSNYLSIFKFAVKTYA